MYGFNLSSPADRAARPRALLGKDEEPKLSRRRPHADPDDEAAACRADRHRSISARSTDLVGIETAGALDHRSAR